jgi:hypothetical protein
MGKFNWRALVGTVAPTLGAALGGPLGGVAGSLAAKAVLGKEKATDAEMTAALASATPEQIAALRKADQDFAVRMKELDVDVFKLETADVQSARQIYAINYWPQITITTLYITGYFVMTWCFITGRVSIPGEHKDMVTMLIGMLTTAIPSILGFWFGSSFGSREKTAALAASKPGDSQ